MSLVETFIGVDADAVGAGTGSNSDTMAIDAWLQQRIQHNNQELLAPAMGQTWVPISGSATDFTSYGGIRPYCAFEWYTLWHGVLWLYRDQTHLELTFAYHAEFPGNTTAANSVEIAVVAGDGTNTMTSPATLTSTYSTGTKTGHQTITVELAERIRRGGLRTVSILARNNTTSIVTTTRGNGSGVTDTGSGYYLYREGPFGLRDSDPTPGYFDPNSSGTGPDGDSLEAMYLLPGSFDAWSNASHPNKDLIHTRDRGSDGTGAMCLQTTGDTAASAIQTTGTLYVHNCLMLRAIHFVPIFTSAVAPSAQSAALPINRFAPIIEFGASEAAVQASAIVRAYRQPSIALIGPRGRHNDTDDANGDLDQYGYNGYSPHWPTILGDFDGTTGGESLALVNEGIFLRTENPVLEVVCKWLSVQHNATFNRKQIATTDQKFRPRREGRIDKVDIIETGGPGWALWDMTITVEQLTDTVSGSGDWDTDVTSYGSLTDEVDIPVFGADVSSNPDVNQPPVLRGTDAHQQGNKGDSSDPGFWFKEGSLFPDHGDFDVLFETTHLVSITGMTPTETDYPLRFELKMDLEDTLGFYQPVQVGIADVNLEQDLRLTLVSVTVIEHPQDP